MKTKKAFTLIELLVVIAIIGILATISVLSLSNARAKSRDAKRAGDIKQIQTALELFFNDNNRYPTAEEWGTGKIYSTSTGATSTYMQIIPNAPTPADGTCTNNQNNISYTPSPDGSSYSISFCLGNTTGTLTSGSKCLTPGGVLNVDCSPWTCGSQFTVTSINGYVCNEAAPYYDKCTYDTVQIGTQCWMKQNMNVGNIVTGATTQTNNSIMEKYCYDDSYGNCQAQGGLYQWNEAMQYTTTEPNQGICPPGWHLPTDTEQHILEDYLKDPGQSCVEGRVGFDCDGAGSKLSSYILNGNNSSGFTGLLAGLRYINGLFYDQVGGAYFWSSSISGSDAWFRHLNSVFSTVYRDVNSQAVGYSVRCLQD